MRLPRKSRLLAKLPPTLCGRVRRCCRGWARNTKRAETPFATKTKQGDVKQWRQHRLHRCTTAFSSSVLKKAKAKLAESSSPTPQKRSHSRARLFLSAKVSRTTKARYSLST